MKQYMTETVSGAIAATAQPLGTTVKRIYDNAQAPTNKNLSQCYELADTMLELTAAIRKRPRHSVKLEALLKRIKRELDAAIKDTTGESDTYPVYPEDDGTDLPKNPYAPTTRTHT